MNNGCPFCDPEEMRSRIVMETEHFYVVPTKGQIVEGYVLVIPKRHAACYGDLTEAELTEAEGILARLRTAITDEYGQAPIVWEHGIIGQTVKHGHIHVFPCAPDLKEAIAAKFPDNEPMKALDELREVFRREGPYLFYESAAGVRTLFHVFRIPMYLRIVAAEALQHPERANWRTMDTDLDARMMKDTCEKLRKKLT